MEQTIGLYPVQIGSLTKLDAWSTVTGHRFEWVELETSTLCYSYSHINTVPDKDLCLRFF